MERRRSGRCLKEGKEVSRGEKSRNIRFGTNRGGVFKQKTVSSGGGGKNWLEENDSFSIIWLETFWPRRGKPTKRTAEKREKRRKRSSKQQTRLSGG